MAVFVDPGLLIFHPTSGWLQPPLQRSSTRLHKVKPVPESSCLQPPCCKSELVFLRFPNPAVYPAGEGWSLPDPRGAARPHRSRGRVERTELPLPAPGGSGEEG